MDFKTINLKQNNETIDIAIFNFLNEIEVAKLEGVKLIKFIHGYGSSGVGGSILFEIKKLCPKLKKQKIIKDYLSGSEWHYSNSKALDVIKDVKDLDDRGDLNNFNMGITLIVVQ